jgi:hypothetical protein
MENPSRNRSSKGRKWGLGRWLATLVLGLGLALICGHVLIRHVIGPQIVKVAVSRAMARRWLGRIDVGRPTFRYSGVMDVETVRLYDPNGKEAIDFSEVTLTLGHWPGLKPKLKSMAISKAQVRVVDGHELDGFFKAQKTRKPGVPGKSVLETIKIDELDICDGKDPESVAVWDNLALVIGFESHRVTFSAKNGKTGEGMLAVTGEVFRPSSDIEMTLQFSRQVTPSVRRVTGSLLRLDSPWSGQGGLSANIKLSGNLKDPRSLKAAGEVRTNAWNLVREQLVIVGNLNAVGQVKDWRIEFQELSGEFCRGDIEGDFHLDIQKGGGVLWGGNLTAENLDIDQFLKLLGHPTGRSSGQGHLQMDFKIVGKAVETLDGTGELMLEDADFGRMPVVSQMFRMIGMSDHEPLKLSDAEARFSIKKGLVEFERGYISNRLSALEIQSGGQINLVTNGIDVYVVGVMLKFVNSTLHKIPLIRRIASFKDKLVRLHVRGKMSKPAISKEPLRDISEEFTEIILEISTHGGNLADAVLKILGSPFAKKKTPSK